MRKILSKFWTSLFNINVILAIAILIPSLMVTVTTTYWYIENTFGNTSMVTEPVANGTRFHVNDTLILQYHVVRYKTCELHLTRIFKRPDLRETQLQYVIQAITGDEPPIIRNQGFQVRIPEGVLNPHEKKVSGEVFTRIQYLCNGLDYLFPRTIDQEKVTITVYAEDVPFDDDGK